MSKRIWGRGPALAFAAVSVVTLVGTGACAFEPGSGRAGVREVPAVAAEDPTGASASPGPDQADPSPTPSAAATSAVPPPAGTKKPTTTTKPPQPAGCPQGERQREVEGYLAALGSFGPVTVDGRQSAADCTAIKKFQQRYGISPATGLAGPTTADVGRRLANTNTNECQAGPGLTACINLTLQTVWVIRDGTVVMPPTITRTGMRGYATPAGTFRINYRNIKEWSVPYKVWLPYWQHFTDGMGFHETTTYIHDTPIGSHGCVNVLHQDAVKLWNLIGVGTTVKLFGRRPGT